MKLSMMTFRACAATCAVALMTFGVAAGGAQTQPAPTTQQTTPPQTAPPAPTPPQDKSQDSASPDDGQTPAGQQAPAGKAGGGAFTLSDETREVRLSATVVDQDGRVVPDLTRDAFHVFEDGVPQKISYFRHEDVPVSLGILIDSSGSMYDKRLAVNQASLDLVKLSNHLDEAFVVDFSWEAFIDEDFTSDVNKLQQGLNYIKSSGGTAMYDALVASADYLSKNAKHQKQVLLIITDGEDNASSATLEAAIRRIQDLDGPTIYCVGLLFGSDTDKTEARHARKVLETLAEQTGGVAYFPKSLKEVDPIAAEVAEDIRTQYTIAYRPLKPQDEGNGAFRTIHVDAKQKGYKQLQVRTRSGYYPTSASAKPTSSTPPSQP